MKMCRIGNQAITEFQDVLCAIRTISRRIDGLGSIIYQMAGTPFTP